MRTSQRHFLHCSPVLLLNSGTVHSWVPHKGFGFINDAAETNADGSPKRFFVHNKSLNMKASAYRALVPGQQVQYELGNFGNRTMVEAVNVRAGDGGLLPAVDNLAFRQHYQHGTEIETVFHGRRDAHASPSSDAEIQTVFHRGDSLEPTNPPRLPPSSATVATSQTTTTTNDKYRRRGHNINNHNRNVSQRDAHYDRQASQHRSDTGTFNRSPRSSTPRIQPQTPPPMKLWKPASFHMQDDSKYEQQQPRQSVNQQQRHIKQTPTPPSLSFDW
ncbi:RNA-binding protein Rpb16, putative [Bodo saltans]|uniref:RNA-binding protein Rpb16, putative n=1 Tax=Bodo saltans TaxID=75058 RepID=A0A0S4IPJ8_BODSA|nr:RNA-binding protein Rpb16, putative [Bodo saltans]|eukprot:CUE98402.1 RNA-binding protein Rpb16, putative [Bodo saltans]